MEEKLVSFETAKLAKEMGYFNGCRASYTHFNEDYIYDNVPEHPESHKKDQINLNDRWFHKNLSEEDCSNEHFTVYEAPTQSLLQKWLRYIYGIHIIIIPTVTSFWTYKTVTVISERDDDVINGIKSVSDLPPYKEVCGYDFNTYEDALEDALFESLKLI